MPTTNNTPITYELLTLRNDVAGQSGHWQRNANSPYGKNSIDESNSSSTTEPTSIPSPFARMELARTAFTIAAACKNWDDVPKRYQKIVSDCLDVAEIFFNYPMYSKFVRIIKWDKANLTKAPLKNTELGKAMNKFMQGDNGTYHFDRLNAIYLLDYIGDNKPNKTGLNIIGATSPITMFFSVDNNLSYVSENIHFTNGDEPFDGGFNPLEKRDINFIQYMVAITKAYDASQGGVGTFANDFKALYDYIQSACNRLPQGVNPSNPNATYRHIAIDEGSNDFVNVLGYFIGCQDEREPENSDFEIDSKLVTTGKLPLVLPTEVGNAYQNCAYINKNELWGNNNFAPVKDTNSPNNRILPGTNIKYPFLTVSDFFEDTIIKMPYKLNSASFFDGNIETDSDKSSFLLPLTPVFFTYFTAEELIKNKNMIKMKVSGPVVTITLNIPIKNHSKKSPISYVSFKKTYQTNENEVSNIGRTETAKFGLGVFPLVKSEDVNVADYRVALFDREGISDVKFFDLTEGIVFPAEQIKERRERTDDICGIKTYVVEKRHFDRIDIHVKNAHGYVIPIFEKEDGSKKFTFAVDFGTTNTHIAYKVDNELDISALDNNKPQMVRLHESYNADRDITAAFDDNYVPNQFLFPIRSAFAEKRPIKYMEKTYTLSDGNIPFRYEKKGPVDYLDIQTGEDLKWSANNGRIELFIRNIAFILHNKVLMEKGKLEDVKIRWFYPASMSDFIRGMMERAWYKAYKDYFDANYVEGGDNVKQISESIAPYYYYHNKGNASGIVTTIDVGGGTTDVYISEKENTDGLLLSFRFASNAIFGDGYNNNISNNGFVKKYKEYFTRALNDEEELSNALNLIALKGNSSELISFFFSLASQDKPGLNFMDKLVCDQKFKYVFLIFYSAIIYHVAQTMKAKGIGLPQTVAFSGNGSKTLQVISPSHETQEQFVKNIFEKVYEEKYPSNYRFYLKFDNDKPKEATANGGVVATKSELDAKPKLVVMLGTDNKTFVTNEKYSKITQEQKREVVANVEKFIDFIPTLNVANSFGKSYFLDVTILDKILEICKQNLASYLDLGLNKIEKLMTEDRTKQDDITESLFFYPIVGMLNNLATEIYEIEHNTNSAS